MKLNSLLISALFIVSTQAQMLDPAKLPAIRVGKTDISGGKIDSMSVQMAKMQFQGKQMPQGAMAQIKQMVVENIVAAELVKQEAQATGVRASKPEIDSLTKVLKAQVGSEKSFTDYLKKMGLSQAQFTKKLEEQIITENMMERVAPYPKEPSEADRQKFFADNKSKLPINDSVGGYQLYLKTDAKDNADSIEAKKDLLKGWAAMVRAKKADFRQIAAEYSDDPDAKKDGGAVKPASAKSFGPQFEQLVKTMKVMDISAPFQSKNGLTIFLLTEKNDGQYESYKFKIDYALMMQREQERMLKLKTFIEGLSKKYKVEFFDKSLKPTQNNPSTPMMMNPKATK